jgi:hypothetical protein
VRDDRRQLPERLQLLALVHPDLVLADACGVSLDQRVEHQRGDDHEQNAFHAVQQRPSAEPS